MSKFRIEILVTLVAISLGVVVVTIGYLSFKSLTNIVDSIHQEALPDNKLFLIKNIGTDLSALEHSARLYVLTDNNDDLQNFYTLEDSIAKDLEILQKMKDLESFSPALIDSFSKFSREKIELWNSIINVHLTSGNIFPAFTGVLKNLSETDSGFEKQVEVLTRADSVKISSSVEKSTIKRRLQRLEWEIYKKNKQRNVVESQLLERNVWLGNRISQLIDETEKAEATSFAAKSAEVDRMARESYKRLALFIISAIIILLIALFVLYNYLRKTRNTKQALTAAREKAEALARAKEQFAANVSHELRTPVNAIYGLSEQILQKKLDHETEELVSVVFHSANHLRNVVNQTLDFTKIQSDKVTLQTIPFSPANVVNEVYAILKNEASSKSISLRLHWKGDKPAALIGDPLQLKQVLINLAGNAVKFTKRGEVRISVTCNNSSEQISELEFNIIDTGVGIAEKDIAQIFEEFVQIENSEGKKYAGTGLGLPIAKKLVELQGGTITVKSRLGEGTTVTVRLSFPVSDASALVKTETENLEIPQFVKNLSVLIADDEEYNRFLLKHIFKKWGARFEEVDNGNDAIKASLDKHFDLILMDLNMPGMSGLEASKSISRSNKNVKIVAVTAANDELNKQTCIDAGMVSVLFKPFSERELLETIEKILNNNPEKNGTRPFTFNTAELLNLAGGDEKFMVEMIRLFIKSLDSGVAGIEVSLSNENYTEIAEQAHKLAAPVKHFGAAHLYENIRLLEKISKADGKTEKISSVFGVIKSDALQLKSNLTAYLEQINA